MTKTQLIEKAAKDAGLTKKSLSEAYDALLAAAIDALVAGDALQLSGFGAFTVKEKAAHTARNPKTNETVELPASRRVSFAASKVLKEKLN